LEHFICGGVERRLDDGQFQGLSIQLASHPSSPPSKIIPDADDIRILLLKPAHLFDVTLNLKNWLVFNIFAPIVDFSTNFGLNPPYSNKADCSQACLSIGPCFCRKSPTITSRKFLYFVRLDT
jgi:hypothetical protein